MTTKATKPKTETVEKPVFSVNVDLYKKEITKDEISVRVEAQLTGNKKEIRTFLFGVASVFNPGFVPAVSPFEFPTEEKIFTPENNNK